MLTTGGGPAVLLRDGRVLVIGGSDTSGKPVASAQIYDPKTGRFSPTGSMVTAPPGGVSVATLLADGRVLVAGGSSGEPCGNGGCPGVATAEIYDPATGKFSPTGSMTEPRWGCTGTLLPDGRVLIAGGIATNSPLTSAEIYDPATGKFSSTASMSGGHSWATATLLPDGRVLIAGGGTAMAELYQP
jgi:hypothetical protein